MFGIKALKGKIRSLESEIDYMVRNNEKLRTRIHDLEGDVERIAKFLGASFENVNTRRLVKKGGPERSD